MRPAPLDSSDTAMRVDANNIVNDAFLALGLAGVRETDPKVITSILVEMKLEELLTWDEPARTFLIAMIKSRPLSTDGYLASLCQTLVQKNPMIVDFLEVSLLHGWLKHQPSLSWSVHVGVVLETLTSAMLKSNLFTDDIYAHVITKRNANGMKSSTQDILPAFWSAWRVTGSFFLAAKVVSIDNALYYFMFQRTNRMFPSGHLQRLRHERKISFFQYKTQLPVSSEHMDHYHDAVRLNIMEACVTEYREGFEDNALCAHVLMMELERHPMLVDENGRQEPLSQEWISLYGSWNAAFLLGNVDDFALIVPKLFIPALLHAETHDYVKVRTFSLWLTLNALLFRQLEGRAIAVRGSASRHAAKAWGDVNRRHAILFAKKHLDLSEAELTLHFRRRFRWPRLSFVRFVLMYFFDTRDTR
jgi:hypothetical protein